jgi:hypothetical protein
LRELASLLAVTAAGEAYHKTEPDRSSDLSDKRLNLNLDMSGD